MTGWIKLHRPIRDHWIWSDAVKFQWWLIMIFECSFKDSKMILGSKLYDVKRGQSTNSIRRWAELFGVGTKSVMNFFKILESENMIKKETLGTGKNSTTLITIVNYENYQSKEETLTTTQGKRKGGTLEESKESKEVIDYLNSKCNRKFKYTPSSLKDIKARLKEGATIEECKKVIDTKNNEWSNDSKMKRYLRPSTLFGVKFESYLNEWIEPKEKPAHEKPTKIKSFWED